MKKMTFFACAALLASTCMFTACKKDKVSNELQEVEEQGSYNGEVVKTEFSISLPNQAAGRPNRMPGTTVQISGASQFQGMGNMVLVPFAKESDIVSGDTRLGDNITLSDINSSSEFGTNSHAKVYPSVSIPMTTATFLFYGKSKATGTSFQKGELNAANLDNSHQPADFTFNLQPIVATVGTPTGSGTSGEALIAYLNSIANAVDENSIAWKNYTTTQSTAMTALFETFSSWHSLSSFSVARGVTDLYNTLAPLSTTLATNIKAAIASTTYAELTGAAVPYTITLKTAYNNFPAEYNLPEGSVRIKWNTTAKAFQACTEAEYAAADNASLETYTYPAALWYFANSQIKTSNSSKQALYDNVNDWTTVLAAHEAATAVNSRTRAVAIQDVIQYGVARLDVIVKLDATTLEDNTAVTAKSISCDAYPVTAVLVGGQKSVGFDFTPKGSTEYTIYDNVMTSAIEATTTNTTANSTLVLESEQGSTKDVMIAIELTNASGNDFIGVDREVIPAGGKFYLIAKLTAAGASVTSNKVFQQDYTTTATLTIKSLKNAYNTIPDLRTPQLELGMSVDLNWTAGNVYNVDIP